MKPLLAATLVLVLTGCASVVPKNPSVSILVDLDRASVERTLIVESITADRNGLLYVADRVSGNVLRVDPKAPTPVVVARIEGRDIQGRRVNADPSGLAFDAQGDLYIAAGPFAEVVRVRASGLSKPFDKLRANAVSYELDRASVCPCAGSLGRYRPCGPLVVRHPLELGRGGALNAPGSSTRSLSTAHSWGC